MEPPRIWCSGCGFPLPPDKMAEGQEIAYMKEDYSCPVCHREYIEGDRTEGFTMYHQEKREPKEFPIDSLWGGYKSAPIKRKRYVKKVGK